VVLAISGEPWLRLPVSVNCRNYSEVSSVFTRATTGRCPDSVKSGPHSHTASFSSRATGPIPSGLPVHLSVPRSLALIIFSHWYDLWRSSLYRFPRGEKFHVLGRDCSVTRDHLTGWISSSFTCKWRGPSQVSPAGKYRRIVGCVGLKLSSRNWSLSWHRLVHLGSPVVKPQWTDLWWNCSEKNKVQVILQHKQQCYLCTAGDVLRK
jgi:hypothetical protein